MPHTPHSGSFPLHRAVPSSREDSSSSTRPAPHVLHGSLFPLHEAVPSSREDSSSSTRPAPRVLHGSLFPLHGAVHKNAGYRIIIPISGIVYCFFLFICSSRFFRSPVSRMRRQLSLRRCPAVRTIPVQSLHLRNRRTGCGLLLPLLHHRFLRCTHGLLCKLPVPALW